MLNALRHHGGHHSTRSSSPRIRSVVLNALRHHGGNHHAHGTSDVGCRRVLNALRHHGGHHGRGSVSRASVRLVLNALRHHGGHHVADGRRRPAPRVLNALRHHGGHHEPTVGGSSPSGCRCSTPCGITESSPSRRFGLLRERSRAQRLAASRRSSLTGVIAGNYGERCSTPCGITEVITSSGLIRRPTPVRPCAQRLAASRRSSRRRDGQQRRARRTHVLNALRHHGGHHALPSCLKRGPQRARDDVLNALRHHGGRHADGSGASYVLNTGAQRLAASRRSSPQDSRRTSIFSAFRLPCSSALRHHGGHHSRWP